MIHKSIFLFIALFTINSISAQVPLTITTNTLRHGDILCIWWTTMC